MTVVGITSEGVEAAVTLPIEQLATLMASAMAEGLKTALAKLDSIAARIEAAHTGARPWDGERV